MTASPSTLYLYACRQDPSTLTEAGYLAAVAEDYGFTPAELGQVLDDPAGLRAACQTGSPCSASS